MPPPAGIARRPSLAGGRSGHADDSDDRGGIALAEVLPTLKAAVWEAWADGLALVSLDFGDYEGARPFLDRSYRKPGLRWLDRVCPIDVRQVADYLRVGDSHLSIDYRLILASGELLWVRHWLLRSSARENGKTLLRGLIAAIP